MKYAFFDFDGTITKHDTFIEFAKFSLGRKRFYTAVLKNSWCLCLWKLGFVSNGRAKQKLFSTLYKGKKYEWFKNCGILFKKEIDKDLNHDIIEGIKQHKIKGHIVVIVSASMPEWIQPWASENGVDTVIGTKIEVDREGIITGKFLTDNCHGKEKAARIKDMFPNICEFETWGYGDSAGDNQMLEMVTHAIRVCSPRLP